MKKLLSKHAFTVCKPFNLSTSGIPMIRTFLAIAFLALATSSSAQIFSEAAVEPNTHDFEVFVDDVIDTSDPNCSFSALEQKCLTAEEIQLKLGRAGTVFIGGFAGGLFGAGSAWSNGGNGAAIAAGWAYGFAGGALGAAVVAAPTLIASPLYRTLLGTSIAGVFQVAGGAMSNTVLICRGPCPKNPAKK
jgi:hypothetical protein